MTNQSDQDKSHQHHLNATKAVNNYQQQTTPTYLYECLGNANLMLKVELAQNIKQALEIFKEKCIQNELTGEFLVRRINDWTDRGELIVSSGKAVEKLSSEENVTATIYKEADTNVDNIIAELETIMNKPAFSVIDNKNYLELKWQSVWLPDKSLIKKYAKDHRATIMFMGVNKE